MSGLNAKEIAQKPYTIEIYEDVTTTGEPIYLAIHPELSGCIAQGETMESAIKELESVTVEYIESLIEDEQPIPEPRVYYTETSSGSVDSYDNDDIAVDEGVEFLHDLDHVVQPNTRKLKAVETLIYG